MKIFKLKCKKGKFLIYKYVLIGFSVKVYVLKAGVEPKNLPWQFVNGGVTLICEITAAEILNTCLYGKSAKKMHTFAVMMLLLF